MSHPLNLAELLSNEELRQHEFPATRNKVFLAHAAVCPLPRRIAQAMQLFIEAGSHNEQELGRSLEIARHTRTLAAHLLKVEPAEIALVGPTSLALSYVAAGFPIQPGDNVLIHFDDYPSNVYPWMALEARGAEVRRIPVTQPGLIRKEDLLPLIDDRTRLVALASCHFLSGYRLDLAEISACLRQRGIAFCVDAIQTMGAFPTLGAHCDFLAADAHKWLLGPCAAGILYVNHTWQDRLRPVVYGWHNVRCPDFISQESLTHPPDARRYEAGTANLIGLVGLGASLELIQEIGIDNIARELLRKRSWLIPALQEKGCSVLHSTVDPVNASGIITLDRPNTDLRALHQKLAADGIITSLRIDRNRRNYLRLTPHFYNTDAELHQLLERI